MGADRGPLARSRLACYVGKQVTWDIQSGGHLAGVPEAFTRTGRDGGESPGALADAGTVDALTRFARLAFFFWLIRSIDIGYRGAVAYRIPFRTWQFAPWIRREQRGSRSFLRSGRSSSKRTCQKRAVTLGRYLLLALYVAPDRLPARQFVTD